MKEISTKKPVRKMRVTEYERRALEIYNSDQRRTYPEITTHRPVRPELVMKAMLAAKNRFQLCRSVSRVTRMVHSFHSELLSVSINKALGIVAKPKPVIVSRRKVAAA